MPSRTILVVGPTPPPYHGNSIFTRQLLASPAVRAACTVVHLETADRRPLENMGRFDLENVRLALLHAGRLVRLIRRHRPDLVYLGISQNALAYLRDAVLILLARAFGCRVATHLHGSEFREFYQASHPAMRWLVRITSRRLAGAAVLSPGLRPIYRGIIPEPRVHTVPNGVEDPFPAGPPTRDAPAPVTITYLGMLYRPKGFLDLLRAAALLADASPAMRFLFAGEWHSPAEEAAARKLVAENQLGDRVAFRGRVDGEAKLRLLTETDIFVFPGIQPEGLPLVVLEAMAAGLPVIATDTGAIRDAVIAGETGCIVGKGRPDELAAAILRLARDPGERSCLGAAGRRRYLEAFTAERSAESLVKFFDAACAAD